jgi:putative colanic acid biosynthesis glycosyltransferase
MTSISFVSIVYNDRSGLKRTVESVDQAFMSVERVSHFEHVIIDGGSTDGTAEYAQALVGSRKITTVVVSEADHGIYDAMNKGVCAASGLGIVFVNGGDTIHLDSCLESVLDEFSDSVNCVSEAGLVYCAIFKVGYFEKLIAPRVVSFSEPRMPGSHQAMLYKRSILFEVPFDCQFEICGDYDNFARILVSGRHFRPVSRILAVFYSGGASSRRPFFLFRESCRISWARFDLGLRRRLVVAGKLLFSIIAVQLLLVFSRAVDGSVFNHRKN